MGRVSGSGTCRGNLGRAELGVACVEKLYQVIESHCRFQGCMPTDWFVVGVPVAWAAGLDWCRSIQLVGERMVCQASFGQGVWMCLRRALD